MARIDSKLHRKVESLLHAAEAALLPAPVLAASAPHLDPGDARTQLDGLALATPELELAPRLAKLADALASDTRRRDYIERYGCAGVRRFVTPRDVTIYGMPVETLPGHINNVYLILEPGHVLLFDVGSGLESSRRDLELGFAVIRAIYQEDVRYEAIDTAIVSHAHIDHFGGVHDVKVRTPARLCVHELDARVISGFNERVVTVSKDIDIYFRRAGVPDGEREEMLTLYMASRTWFKPVEVDRTLRDGDLIGNGHRVIHTPGHCPGHICLLVGDVLLTGDHVLARITPHQFPQAITAFGGLEHYFQSLAKVRKLELVNLALGGHEEPIADLRTRVDEIAAFHRARLMKVLELCAEPRTIVDVTAEMFGGLTGYGRILAIEEAGAHVEYLHQLGKLKIANLDEVALSRDPVIQYVKR